MLWLLAATFSGAIAAPVATDLEIAALLSSPTRHVRTTNARVASLVAQGARRSRTFRGLVAALNLTDVIVYIEPSQNLPAAVDGRLVLLPLANQQRYLRIQIRANGNPNEVIALIGHELRHALEVASEPLVRDESALVKLYERIGCPGVGMHSYDTVAAQTTGRAVRQELAG